VEAKKNEKGEIMKQPELNEIPIPSALPATGGVITASPGQWDPMLEAAYLQGWLILELDHQDRPKRAYRKAGVIYD